ncbi:hypothetical protein NGTWS0302_15690 [Mycolicibacterium cyprinidarum]|uniref:34 kDa antigenic protein n=1 Tax=Mycolicibacterium cyprinidarum TaxID=2860311 RepID=A0ABQ4VAG6_9MYCO|nr:hypothetical protein NGTWS1803_31350 [Mycolicibacterium sp. NGTWS1803]GJF16433.1 hypothetical protein NGTWS1702_21310 [Mycolicibacterium sp. NGTWSNA01]GJF18062.1 hypothetical protein NGTWS0302_15690 [Mycolicibacterium sp. NGTWS0302]
MSYPQGAPGGPGYPPAQQQNTQFAAPTQQFAKFPEGDAAGVSKLPMYLAAAVAALGFLVYLASFGPQFTAGPEFSITPFRIDLAVVASLLAALIAGAGLLPRQTARPALLGVLSLLSFLLVISMVLTAPDAVTIDWGMYLLVAFTAIQTILGVGALLLDAGIITAPVPRPRYEQSQQYGQYPGGYYGQPQGQPQHGAPMHQQAPPQQRSGYPSQYGGSGYPSTGPSTGGFPAAAPSEESGPPTPPTGFPTYGRPSSSNGPTTQTPTQQTQTPTQHQSPPSSQSDQASS